MKPAIIYNVFIRDFKKQRKRITLTLLALCWGTLSIMLLLGFGEGLQQQMTIVGKGMGDGIAIMWGGQTSIPYKGMGKGRPIRFYADDIEYLRKTMPELEMVGGEISMWGVRIKYKDNLVSEHVVGVTPNYEIMRNMIPEAGGRMINEKDMQLTRRVAFLGDNLKERLFGPDDAVGAQILVNGTPFTVIGVLKHKTQNSSYYGPDENMMVIPLTTAATMYGTPRIQNIVYKPADLSQNAAVERRMFEVLGAKYRFDPDDDRALSVWDTVEGKREFTKLLIGVKIFLGIIGGLTLLIAGVGVANIMYVSIRERTREIGVKMAMGARRSYILAQFLIEALMITFIGGALGMAISYILTESFKRLPMDSMVLEQLGRPTLSMEIGILTIAILGVMGVLSGLFPAMKAASVNPVESLRYE